MLIGAKIQLIKDDKLGEAREYFFHEKHLAEIIMQGFWNEDFFKTDSVQKIIEFQY